MADANNAPLSLDAVESIQFLIARIDVDPETNFSRYVNYFTREVEGAEYRLQGELRQPTLSSAIQPTFESGDGLYQQVATGVYTYTFSQSLGEDYDSDATHVVGMEVIRGPRDVAANPTYTFVPSGSVPTATRNIATTDSCNACHESLSAHGGSRQQVGLCVLCHTPQNTDPETGNSLDMKVMIHRIHAGVNLPSIQEGGSYYIVGFGGSVHDYSSVSWPQDIRNCETCHTGPDGGNYINVPSTAACTSCHDDVNPAERHAGRPRTDAECSECHGPDYVEFDPVSIAGIHLLPRYSTQVSGVNFDIVDVQGVAPGSSPVVAFRITDDSGEVIVPQDMDYLAFTLAGPTKDYTHRVTERISSDSVLVEGENGVYSFSFATTLPGDVSGTYAIGMEGYRIESLGEDEEEAGFMMMAPRVDEIRVAGFNPVVYAAVDGGAAEPRHQIVDRESCNSCHKDLALHGTIRQNTEYCVLCHTANATDEAQRPTEAMPPESINFPVLIHRVHRGESAGGPFQVYGFGGSIHDYGEVEFPGDIGNCQSCHLPGTYGLPTGLQPTQISQNGEVVSVTPPVTAICTACHNSAAARGHAELETTASSVETCVVCHDAGREFDVANAHP